MSEAEIAIGRVLVAVDAAGLTIGVAGVTPEGVTADLEVLFIDPPAIADPHAAPFYERMGARFVRNAPSDAIPDRTLPLYEYDITAEGPP